MKSIGARTLRPRGRRPGLSGSGRALLPALGVLLLAMPLSVARGADEVIILSPRLGTVIDATEREQFGFFLYIDNFREAAFYRTPEMTYYAVVRRHERPDTTISFSESVLEETAEIIENFEAIRERRYHKGTNTPVSYSVPPEWRSDAEDLLPFAKHASPRSSPAIGLGFGIGSYHAGLEGVERAFQAIEDVYRSSGYPIPDPPEIQADPMQLWALTIRVSSTWQVACQAGLSGGESNRIKLLGGLLTARFPIPGTASHTLHASIGGGRYGFSLSKTYGVRITPIESNGGYSALEEITLSGGGGYVTAGGGITLHVGRKVDFDLLAQRFHMGEETATREGLGKMSVDLSGTHIGVRLTLFR